MFIPLWPAKPTEALHAKLPGGYFTSDRRRGSARVKTFFHADKTFGGRTVSLNNWLKLLEDKFQDIVQVTEIHTSLRS